MQIQYTGQHLDVTDAMRSYTEKKLKKIQSLNNVASIHVIFSVEKMEQIAEAKIGLPGTQIHAKASSPNIYESIDKLSDKLMRQLIKYKEKNEGRD